MPEVKPINSVSQSDLCLVKSRASRLMNDASVPLSLSTRHRLVLGEAIHLPAEVVPCAPPEGRPRTGLRACAAYSRGLPSRPAREVLARHRAGPPPAFHTASLARRGTLG